MTLSRISAFSGNFSKDREFPKMSEIINALPQDPVAELRQGVAEQARRAMRSAEEMFDSLCHLAKFFIKYFDCVERSGWDAMMLHDANKYTYNTLPHHSNNPWSFLKATSRQAFEQYPRVKGWLPLQ